MIRHGFRAVLVAVLVTGMVAGCKSKPEEPVPEVVPTPVVEPPPPPPPEPEPPKRFEPGQGVVDPDTGQLLSHTFYFEYDQARIASSDLAVLAMHADFLRDFQTYNVLIEGHCDERGTREYNLALGERRGQAVQRYLTSAGVRSNQIEVVSFGEERPADPGSNESAWAKNRRAVLIYRER